MSLIMQLGIIQKSFTIIKGIINLLERKMYLCCQDLQLPFEIYYFKNTQTIYQINLQMAYWCLHILIDVINMKFKQVKK